MSPEAELGLTPRQTIDCEGTTMSATTTYRPACDDGAQTGIQVCTEVQAATSTATSTAKPTATSSTATPTGRHRWLALLVLCLGDLMIVLDTTIVNVALPSIRQDLGFSETSLAWV